MSSVYYGSIAGEMADEMADAERRFLEWFNEYTRSEAEPGRTAWDEMRAAFLAGNHLPVLLSGAVRDDQELAAEARRVGAELRRRDIGDLDRHAGLLMLEMAARLDAALMLAEFGVAGDPENPEEDA